MSEESAVRAEFEGIVRKLGIALHLAYEHGRGYIDPDTWKAFAVWQAGRQSESKGNAQAGLELAKMVSEYFDRSASNPPVRQLAQQILHAPAAPERPTIKAIVSDRGNWRLEIDGEACRAEDARQIADKLNGLGSVTASAPIRGEQVERLATNKEVLSAFDTAVESRAGEREAGMLQRTPSLLVLSEAEQIARQMYDADLYRREYEEHLNVCTSARLIIPAPRKDGE